MVAITGQLARALGLCDSVKDLLESGARDPEAVARILQRIKDVAVGGKRISFKDRTPNEQWERTYRIVCGKKKIDCAGIALPSKPDFACWPIIVMPEVPLNAVLAGLKSKFSCWSYCGDDLERAIDWQREERDGRKEPYGIWVRAIRDAREELHGISADTVKGRGLKTITLNERICLEAFHWVLTGGAKRGVHLDQIGWNICTGSRYSDGDVPRVDWDGGAVSVDWTGRGDAIPDVGVRQVVAL